MVDSQRVAGGIYCGDGGVTGSGCGCFAAAPEKNEKRIVECNGNDRDW